LKTLFIQSAENGVISDLSRTTFENITAHAMRMIRPSAAKILRLPRGANLAISSATRPPMNAGRRMNAANDAADHA
jgi:hypothetical protein